MSLNLPGKFPLGIDRHWRDDTGQDDNDADVPQRQEEEGGLSDRGGRIGALLPSYWSALSSTTRGNGEEKMILTSELTAYPEARLSFISTVSEHYSRQASLRRVASVIASPSLSSMVSTNTLSTGGRAVKNEGLHYGPSTAPQPVSSVATIPSVIEAVLEDGGGVLVGGAAADRPGGHIAMQSNRVWRGLCPGCGKTLELNLEASSKRKFSLSVEDSCEVMCRVCRLNHRCADGTHPLEASLENDFSRGNQRYSKVYPMVANLVNWLGKGGACGWVDRNPRKIALIAVVAVVALIAVSTALLLVAKEYQQEESTVPETTSPTNASDLFFITFPTRSPTVWETSIPSHIMNQPEYEGESDVAVGESDFTGGSTFKKNIITVPSSP